MDAPPDQATSVVKVRLSADGRPVGAAAVARIERPVAEVWAALVDIERFARHLPMVRKATRTGDDVTLDLGFKIVFFSVGFSFSAHATYEAPRRFELRWTSGEPRDIVLRFELTPTEDGAACVARTDAQFDIMSLGWLSKYFLRGHPEIQFGVFPGVALVLADSLRRAVARGA
jgi:carbon monoxide dehydrogenase subunit G